MLISWPTGLDMAPHAGKTVCHWRQRPSPAAARLQNAHAPCTGRSAAPGLESGLSLPQHLWLGAVQLRLHGLHIKDWFHIPCRLTGTTFRGRAQSCACASQWWICLTSSQWATWRSTTCLRNRPKRLESVSRATDTCLPARSMQGYYHRGDGKAAQRWAGGRAAKAGCRELTQDLYCC